MSGDDWKTQKWKLTFARCDDWVDSLGPAADERKPRERIMHSLKRFTARECNKLLGRQGTFWQDESYDHSVRNEDELERIIDYVELNPVGSQLAPNREAWPFSSANDRMELGTPLVRPR